ncbi:MAG: TolC family protein [Verrucomicrobiales bacterium]|nr:TolC family protein [Verrucomicrobiales bacterium]
MKINTNTLVILAGLLIGPAFSQTLTLPEATRLMLEFEPELNATEYDTLSAIENIKVTRADLLPQVSLTGSAGVSNRDRTTDGLLQSGETLFQRQLGLSVRQLLFDGGVARNNTRASENAMMAQQYLEKGMIESRVVDLAEVYMEVLRTEKQIALANDNIENHRKMVELIKKKVENGGHRTEVQLAQSRLNRATNVLSSLQLGYNRALTRLARLVGTNTFVLTYPTPPPIPQNPDEISLEDNWEFLAAAEALEEAEHRANAVKASNKPQFYLDAGYNVGRDVIGINGRDDEVSALIVGEWQLFSGGRKKATERREHFQVGKFEELKRSADIARHHDMDLLWQERNASTESGRILRSYQADLGKVVADYEKRFTLGREDLLNILDMQTEYYSVSSDLVDTQFDYDTNAFRIKGKQGQLTEWLLLLNGSSNTQLTSFDAKNPQAEAIPVAFNPDEDLQDERVPLTQVELMKRVFDGEGPTALYEPAPMEQYYEEETNSRQNWLRKALNTRRERNQTSPVSDDESSSKKKHSHFKKY